MASGFTSENLAKFKELEQPLISLGLAGLIALLEEQAERIKKLERQIDQMKFDEQARANQR